MTRWADDIPAAGGPPPRRYSLRLHLFALVCVCVLPALAVIAWLAYTTHELQRQKVDDDTLALAQTISAAMDRELSAIESGLRVLATSDALRHGDLVRFHRLASDALDSQIVYNYILTDRGGRQRLNTLRPIGEPLPVTGTPPQLEAVFRDGVTVLTDLFIGPVTRRAAIAMGVPVRGPSGIEYSLNIGLSPDKVSEMLQRQPVPEGWLVAVLDRQGTIVGRSRDGDRFVGQPAVPELREAIARQERGSLDTHTKDGIAVVTSHVRSSTWGWHVVIGAPRAELHAQRQRLLAGFLAVSLFVFGAGTWLAARLANRVISSVQQLNAAALAMRNGEPVALPTVQLREAEAVGLAITDAARLMADARHRAQHDPLTGLANRARLDEHLTRRVAAAQPLALLMLDLDRFKAVNDLYGHAAGDELLRTVARRVRSAIRTDDEAARLGGDEFVVLLAGADAERAAQKAEQLRTLLQQPYGDIDVPVSASIGVATYPGSGRTASALLAAADEALYRAKHAGKNRVEQAAPVSPA